MNLFKKEPKKEEKQLFIERMKGMDYIDSSRRYLDYLEEHLNNVSKAFDELSRAASGKEYWVGDDYEWHCFKSDVENHDLSKFTKYEFCQYRDHFFPVSDYDKANSGFSEAWEHHKSANHHHHETVENFMDLVHMVIDWMAMSYKFGGHPREYYQKIKHTMKFDQKYHDFIEKHFSYIDEYRLSNKCQS